MKYLYPFLLLTTLFAQESTPSTTPPATVAPTTPSKSLITLDPKNRADDLVQAFELLRKEKSTLKITLRGISGAVLSNVTDMSAASKGTLLFVKTLTNQGSKLVIIPVEEIADLNYAQ